ncbi:MAG: hypothetical protein LJE95_09370 [Acidobacteria bacterium]|nr:hypothetical protein [Acidobacteriota bacterium]
MKTLTSRALWTSAVILAIGLLVPVRQAAAAVPAPPPTPAPTRPAGVFSGSVQVTNVSVLIRATDANGHPVTDLRSNEVEVKEDGVPAAEVSIEPLVPKVEAAPPGSTSPATPTPVAAQENRGAVIGPVRVTVYVQADLLNRNQLSWVIQGLRNESDKLVGLGTVSLVVADPEPTTVAKGISTPKELERAVERLKKHVHLYSTIERIRRDFRRDAVGATAGIVRHLALISTAEELRRVGDEAERLRAWNTAQGRGGARILVLASGGFELDPWAYYSQFLDPQSQDRSATEDQRVQLAHQWQTVSQELAGNGWTVLGFSGGMPGMNATWAAETSGHEAFSSFTGGSGTSPAGATLADQGTTVSFGLDPLGQAARDSGGAVATSPARLASDLQEMQSAYILSYTITRPPDSEAHRLQIRVNRPGVSVRAPVVLRLASHHGSDRARALALLSGHGGSGEVPLEVAVEDINGSHRRGYSGRLVVTGHLAAVLPLILSSKAPAMEITVAVDAGSGEPFVSQGQPMPLRLADRQGTWIFESPIQWPGGSKTVAVVVSETTTDTWGGAVAKLR